MAKFHPESEFNQLDFGSLIQEEFETNGKNYNFSKGGSTYVYGSGWFITTYDENDNYEIWQIPSVISRFIDWSVKNSVK